MAEHDQPDDVVHVDEDAVAVEKQDPATQMFEQAGTPAKADEALPNKLVALPLNQRPVFPTMMLPLVIPEGRLAESIKFSIEKMDGFVGFFLTRTPLEEGHTFTFEDLHTCGSIARIVKAEEHEESGGLQVIAQVVSRFRIKGNAGEDPFVIVRGIPEKAEVDTNDPKIRAYAMAIVTSLKDLAEYNPVFAEEIQMVLANFNNIDGPGRLADLAATLTTAKREDIQSVLETLDVIPRMEKVLGLLAQEKELSQMKARISNQINDKISDNQRRFFLHEQLKAIKEELGLETDEKSLEIQKFQEAFEAKREHMSEEVVSVTEEELRKLSLLDPSSSEYGVARGRLEWILDMPWGVLSEDQLDLDQLKKGLDKDHYGLSDIKERITEFVAVRRLKNDQGGGIICLVGPPGTGKTSIGASIARQLGREFFRFSVGGMRDEAEIKGHRRTYVGALPGKMVQALRRCKTMNPVVLLDEIDKMSQGMQGDPASALLEVLDPEQNHDFLDHYLDVRVDLSQVLFVCTANDLGGIPDPLRDRMEIIRLAGYIEKEKVAIARKYLVPKQRKKVGLAAKDISFGVPALTSIVRGYAREAGVRRLEQLIGKICRKVATTKAEAESRQENQPKQRRSKKQQESFTSIGIAADNIIDYLGKPFMTDEELIGESTPGVVTGLAWTSMGGATLEIEAIAIPTDSGKGGFQLTGQLGDVMKESAGLARSYLRANGAALGVDPGFFDSHIIHIHVPAGATPKDGPSAGTTMATAMLSLALDKPVKRRFGMTGELTLTGRVYPIGGVREKIVAARRAGLKQILLPRANERDYDELPDFLKKGIKTTFVGHINEVITEAGLLRKSAVK